MAKTDKLTEQQKYALIKSIDHWRRLRDDPIGCAARDELPNWQSCSLCAEFLRGISLGDQKCNGCPIQEKTGLTSCMGTPFNEAANAIHDIIGEEKYTKKKYKAIQKEIDFLVGILMKRS